MVEIYSNFYLYQMVEKGVEPNKSILAIADSVGISKPFCATLSQPENAVGSRRKSEKSVRPLISLRLFKLTPRSEIQLF